MPIASIPSTMHALELCAYDGQPESLAVVRKPVPQPGPGEVLVQIAASPINPSDLLFLRGLYGEHKPLPVVPGLEASGIVIAAGKGLVPRWLLGKRVACFAGGGDGAWAEYMATSASRCIPLPRAVSLEQGAMAVVNPLTAWALLEIARKEKHPAVLQTAAAGAFGRIIVQLGQKRQLPVINVVRRPEQAEHLRLLGVDSALVLDGSQADFDEHLRDVCHRWQATLALDAVAGEMTGRLLKAMPKHSKIIIYGDLSREACSLDAAQLIFEGKRVEGFWMEHPVPLSRLDLFRATVAVTRRLNHEFKGEVRLRLPLEAAATGLANYAANASEGKVLFTPSLCLASTKCHSDCEFYPKP